MSGYARYDAFVAQQQQQHSLFQRDSISSAEAGIISANEFAMLMGEHDAEINDEDDHQKGETKWLYHSLQLHV